MKTTMQELIEASETFNGYDLFKWVAKNKTNLLEKEKEQIIDAVNSQWQIGYEVKGEDYYNETYENNL